MASQALLIVLNRCITDKKFCDLLLTRPQEAVRNYDLSEAECQALMNISATDLVDLVKKLADVGLVVRENETRK
jgi:hypothetical protein